MAEIRNLEEMRRAVQETAKAEEIELAELTDLGNSDRLIRAHGRDIYYCYPWKTWLFWDGQRWTKDQSGELERLAASTAKKIGLEAAAETKKDRVSAIYKHAARSQAQSRLEAMIDLARMHVPVLPSDLDQNPWLFNTLNGTLNLRTGELQPHDRKDRLTKLAPVLHDPAAKCPNFDRFILEITDNRPEMVQFLSRIFGLALTGDTTEQVFFLFHGLGANGKSTLLETMRALLGDYASQADFQTFLSRRGETVSNDLAALRGSRLVTASEASAGRSLNESLIKSLTGGEPITTRFLYGEFFTYQPEFKLILATNHKPQIRGTDLAIWRRIQLVPFDVSIPADKQDRDLLSKLKLECSGILNWCLMGLKSWQENGLAEPEPVVEASLDYKETEDELGPFLADRCVLTARAETPCKILNETYATWCEQNKQKPVSRYVFSSLLEGRGLKRGRNINTRFWKGIGLLNDAQ